MKKDKVVSKVLGEESVLTPSDLYNREFKRVFLGGYESREVDEYLERVADVLETLITQVRTLKEAQEELKDQLQEYRQMEATLRDALMSSQKFGEDVIETAKREAGTIVAQAEAEGERRLAESAKLPPALAEEIAQLREQRNRLRSDILAILATHRALLNNLDSAEEALEPHGEDLPVEPGTETDQGEYDAVAAEPEEAGAPDEDAPPDSMLFIEDEDGWQPETEA